MMQNLREWTLDPSQPFVIQLAADARLSRTSYVDDQVWQLTIGTGESPALSLQTRYGGRASMVSLVPMWTYDGQVIYQSQTYHQAPLITGFAPDLVTIEAMPVPGVKITILYRALESHAIGGSYTVSNTTDRTVQLRLDIFAHVIIGGKEEKPAIINLVQGGNAIFLGPVGNLEPVIMMENANIQDIGRVSPKIGVNFNLEPGQQMPVQWVHAGLTTMRSSMTLAQRWLETDWQKHLSIVDQAAIAIPVIQSSDLDRDAVIASSYNRLIQAFLKPAGNLPAGIAVGTRNPATGYSKRGDGSDHPRTWSGQDPTLMYLVAPVMATIDPELAQGIIRNYLAVQAEDGWIDYRPGPAGQKLDLLCLPLLARITRQIHDITEDDTFLEAVFPGLMSFLERWLADDLDRDSDNVPEWQDERQTGYMAFPTFAAQPRLQGADISTVESPDLLAYLLSEIDSLRILAERLGDDGSLNTLNDYYETLQSELAAFWQSDHFVYRDRDTHQTTPGKDLLKDAPGDQEHFPADDPDSPSRLVIRIVGGVRHVPTIKLTVDGLDDNGNTISETLTTDDFRWQNRQGFGTTQSVFSQVDRVQCDGLSRVYQINVRTLDTTTLDINALLPLWSGAITPEQADNLAKLVTDKKHFRQPMGITMVSAQEPAFDPANVDGGGGVWLYWMTLVLEGLLQTDQYKKAGDIMRDFLKQQGQILADEGEFYQFYHSDRAQGSGEGGHLSGIVPLYLLSRLFGVTIVSSSKVWTGGKFAWDRGVTIRQHGVYVRRTRKQIKIRFPSGHAVTLDGDADWQAVIDPEPVLVEPVKSIELDVPELPVTRPSSPAETPGRIIIEVEHDD